MLSVPRCLCDFVTMPLVEDMFRLHFCTCTFSIISLSSPSNFKLMGEYAQSLYDFDTCTEAPGLQAAKSLQLVLLV